MALDLITLLLAKRKGVPMREAVVYSALPASGLSTAGKFVLADKVTDRLVAKTIPITQPKALSLKVGSGGKLAIKSGAIPLGIPFTPPKVKPTPAKAVTYSACDFIQDIEGAMTVYLDREQVKIEGSKGIQIDFRCPFEGKSLSLCWDFGDPEMRTSNAKNPVTKTYDNEGEFDVTLTSTDETGKETEWNIAKVIITEDKS